MSRNALEDNVRIIIEPRDFWFFGTRGRGTPEANAKHAMSEAERIVAEINRHVDQPGHVSIAYERKALCSHCGDVGEYSSIQMWPECCEAEQREFCMEHGHESNQWFAEHGMNYMDLLSEIRQVLIPPNSLTPTRTTDQKEHDNG